MNSLHAVLMGRSDARMYDERMNGIKHNSKVQGWSDERHVFTYQGGEVCDRSVSWRQDHADKT